MVRSRRAVRLLGWNNTPFSSYVVTLYVHDPIRYPGAAWKATVAMKASKFQLSAGRARSCRLVLEHILVDKRGDEEDGDLSYVSRRASILVESAGNHTAALARGCRISAKTNDLVRQNP